MADDKKRFSIGQTVFIRRENFPHGPWVLVDYDYEWTCVKPEFVGMSIGTATDRIPAGGYCYATTDQLVTLDEAQRMT